MKKFLLATFICCLSLSVLANKQIVKRPAAIDFDGFIETSKEVSEHRKKRLIELDTFIEMANNENTIVLDTRSLNMFNSRHIKGAVHLNFSDFTQEKLTKIIPDKNTRILIYCNNNFTDDPAYFALKAMPLALNIPTFINLYGYDYKNVYELDESVSVTDPRLKFYGTFEM